MKTELDLPEIEGFEYTGEYRKPKAGEFYLGGGKDVHECILDGSIFSRPVMERVASWVVPTEEYLQENHKWGETVKARFRDIESDDWHVGYLRVIEKGVDLQYFDHIGNCWRYCEIWEEVK